MYEPKAEIYTILSGIEDATVYQVRPEILKTFPCITFSVGANIPEYVLSRNIAYQDIDIVIDIYAKTSKESGQLLATLHGLMLSNNYRMVFCSDIPDEISHITTRFNLIG